MGVRDPSRVRQPYLKLGNDPYRARREPRPGVMHIIESRPIGFIPFLFRVLMSVGLFSLSLKGFPELFLAPLKNVSGSRRGHRLAYYFLRRFRDNSTEAQQ